MYTRLDLKKTGATDGPLHTINLTTSSHVKSNNNEVGNNFSHPPSPIPHPTNYPAFPPSSLPPAFPPYSPHRLWRLDCMSSLSSSSS